MTSPKRLSSLRRRALRKINGQTHSVQIGRSRSPRRTRSTAAAEGAGRPPSRQSRIIRPSRHLLGLIKTVSARTIGRRSHVFGAPMRPPNDARAARRTPQRMAQYFPSGFADRRSPLSSFLPANSPRSSLTLPPSARSTSLPLCRRSRHCHRSTRRRRCWPCREARPAAATAPTTAPSACKRRTPQAR